MGILNKLFGLQEVASEHGDRVDYMMELVHWFMLILFVGWSIFLTYVLIRFRAKRQERAIYSGVQSHASSHLEVGVILAELVLLLGFAFPLWSSRVDQFPDPDVRVNAWAEQFAWNFHYAGADGKFGMTNRFLISSSNPIGIDPDDPNSMDDVVTSNILVLPKGKKVEIAVTSKDVIHNLALKSMRIATDADPGKVSRMWFIPVKAGESEIICGQLCGPVHGNMRAILDVKATDKEYEEWLGEQNTFKNTPAGLAAWEKLSGSSPAAPAAEAVVPILTPEGAAPAVEGPK